MARLSRDETEYVMKPAALIAAAVGAVVALAACSHQAAPSAAPASHAQATHHTVMVNCPQQYHAWKAGPAGKLTSALNVVDSATTAGNVSAATAALKEAEPAVVRAARYPIPACADPKGYWAVLLMHVNAAAVNVRSVSGRASVALALKGVPKLERQLKAELKSTAGVK
jgi:hypothetical protein